MWKRKTAKLQQGQSVLAARVSRLVHVTRERWVQYMQRREAGLTVRQKKWRLALFLLFFGCCFSIILVETMFKRTKPGMINITPIAVPQQRTADTRFKLSREDTLNIRSFRAAMDSLQSSPEGRAVLDEYFSRRPGMLDSFLMLENMIR